MLFLGGVFPKSRIIDWEKTCHSIECVWSERINAFLGIVLLGKEVKLRGTSLKNWTINGCKRWARDFEDLPKPLLKISFLEVLTSQELKQWIFEQVKPHVKSLEINEIDLH